MVKKINSTAEISVQELEAMLEKDPLGKVIIQDEQFCPRGRVYDLDSMLSIKREIEKFLKNCPQRDENNPNSEKEIFAYIYTKIALLVEEDNLPLNISQNASKNFKAYASNYLNGVNGLMASLVLRKTTTDGYIELLRNLLAEKNIEVQKISGKFYSSKLKTYFPKVWMRVRLGGKLYNCDIVEDKNFITKGLIAPYFLTSDKDCLNFGRYEVNRYYYAEKAEKSVSTDEQQELISGANKKINSELEVENKLKPRNGFLGTVRRMISSLRQEQPGDYGE